MKKVPATPVRILLADDNQHGLTARRMILEELGHAVEVSSSGAEAWAKFQEALVNGISFDIVVTDYRMGDGIDGVELIQRIRQADTGLATATRVIMLSAYTEILGMSESEIGADVIIPKTHKEVQELLRAVKKLAHHPPRRRPPSSAKSQPKADRKSASA